MKKNSFVLIFDVVVLFLGLYYGLTSIPTYLKPSVNRENCAQ